MHLFERSLIVLQIVLSLVLLYSSGLFIRTLRNLENSDVGYRRTNLLIAEIDPWAAGYKNPQVFQLARNLVGSLNSLPGLSGVSFSENGMFNGTESASSNGIEGFVPQTREDSTNRADRVGARYFSTVGVPLVAGREIGDQDTAGSTKVAVINQAMARFYFKNRDPLGRHITDLDGKNPLTIIGVVGDAKQSDLRQPAARRYYTPYFQAQDTDQVSGLRLEIRTSANSGTTETTIRRVIHQVDPNLREPTLHWAETLIEDDLQTERVIAQLSGFFSALALSLAAVGLYGVMSYLTARRTMELGVRMALGATRTSVAALIFRDAFSMATIGLILGVACTLAGGKLTAGSLYGVSAFDPLTVATASAIICGAALFAVWLPARRAARLDPMVALRSE